MDEGFVTWSDVRRNKPDRSPEYHLYYSTTEVSKRMAVGDFLLIAKCRNDAVLVVVAEADSTSANQIQWLFGLDTCSHPGFSVREELETEQDRLSFASRIILETIGINTEDTEDTEDTLLDTMLEKFHGQYPDTKAFSHFARSKTAGLDPLVDPDVTIMTWMERELILFQTLERYFVGERLREGFIDKNGNPEVGAFLKASLSVQNRRKKRAGLALENHLEELFRINAIRYERNKITENNFNPDFLFPGQKEYHDMQFPATNLSMLALKTSSKDRWRQVLSEADRIENKHLLTLEPRISTNQTNQMQSKNLQLVVPASLHATYTLSQQSWLMSISAFIEMVRSKQA